MISRDNVLVHEWIGLNARISKCSCREMEGIRGRIIDETRNTLVLEDGQGNVKRIPKKTCAFELEFAPGNWTGIDGKDVCYAPEERLKKLAKRIR